MLAATLALGACGGGGGGGDNNNNGGGGGTVTAPSALSYSSPQSYTINTAITPLMPTVTGTVTGYSVSPTLPAGLALDATTGAISGTPTAAAAAAPYTITASNSAGSTTFALSIEVLAAAPERATTDRTDEQTGPQIHVMYVIPSDGTDNAWDTGGQIQGSVRSLDNWFATQTGGPKLRFDTYDGGKLDVTFLQLARTDADMNAAGGNVRLKMEYALLANGFDSVDKTYLVYYGGSGDGCGSSAWPPANPGNVSVVYLGSANCSSAGFVGEGDAPGYWEFLGAHESLHPLGFAAACAPHQAGNGHVNDSPHDLMFSGSNWAPTTLDVNHDDYFGAANAGCPDLSASEFLDPSPAGATAPPGWPYANLTDDGCDTETTVTPMPTATDTQSLFVNNYDGTSAVDVSELVLDTGTGTYVRQHRVSIPYLQGASVASKEGGVLVASVGSSCVAVVHAAAGFGRFVVHQ